MPRKRAVPTLDAPPTLEDQPIGGIDAELEALGQDPAPSEPRTRRRAPAAKAPAKKALGRPRNPVRTAAGKSMTLDQMKAKVYTELYGFASMLVAVWEIKDAECAGVLSETTVTGDTRLQAIVGHTVDILAHNRPTIEFLANSGAAGSVLMLVAAGTPVVKKVVRHHGPTGVGHDKEETAGYADRFPAHQGAAYSG